MGSGKFSLDTFPTHLAEMDGFITLPVILDPTVGEEIGIFWMDRTPFIHELAAIKPFDFYMKSGLFGSDFGPLMWMLFFVPNPNGDEMPFASMEYHLNPSDPSQIAHLRRLANQSHWHLALLGAGNRVTAFFEFENNFQLAEALDVMEQVTKGMHVSDFMQAKQAFWDAYSMDDLYLMD